MEKHNDDRFTFYAIGVVMLFMSAIFAGALGDNPLNIVYFLVPGIFGSVGLIFLIGTYAWSSRYKIAKLSV